MSETAPATPAGMEPHRGTLVLVLGILSIVFCGLGWILGPIAMILGKKDMEKMSAGSMDPAGMQNTKLGKTLGLVGLILGVLIVLFYAVTFILAIVGAAAG